MTDAPRPGSMITTSVELVTPATAAEYLSRAAPNRHLHQAVVRGYADDMRAGRWSLSPEPIVFDEQGQLINGQHRLSAVVLSGTTVSFTVSRGWTRSIFTILDSGLKRRLDDVLSTQGHVNGRLIAAGLIWQVMYETGRIAKGRAKVPGHERLLEVLAANPGIVDAAHYVASARRLRVLLPPAIAVWLYYQLARRNEPFASDFFDRLGRGTDLAQDDPVYVLRERLLRMRSDGVPHQHQHFAALVIRAWNAALRGQKLIRLQQGVGDAFPDIAGTPTASAA